MFKKIYILLTLTLLISFTGVAYAAPPAQEQSQKGIIEVAREAGNFTTLIQALDAANLSDILADERAFTIFAPTDEAFAALPEGTLEDLFANPEALRNVLSYHVVEGTLTATDLMDMDSITTLQGSSAEVAVDGETLMLGGATVLKADILASNGIIHAIDTVIMPPSSTTEMEDSSTEEDSATMVEGAVSCSEDYVVQANDSLSQIAERFYGDLQAFSTIVEATNAMAASNQIYSPIDDPNVIVEGQVLCIPGPILETQTPTTTAQMTSALENAEVVSDENMMVVPEGKSIVIFENLSSFDVVIDFSGPTPDSLVVPPGTKQKFILTPGQYGYDGHQPGGGFDIAPGQFELTTQQPIQLICYDNEQCQVQSLDMSQATPQQ